ncbi:MAG: hypothetical protein AAF236_03605 [Verrucomicrobiota bacterium]
MDHSLQLSDLDAAANSVRQRVRLVRWARVARWSCLVGGVIGIGLVLWMRRGFGWRSDEIWLALALLGFSLLIAVVYAISRSLDRGAALSLLDRLGQWRDRFRSSYEFLIEGDTSPGVRLHLSRAQAALGEAVQDLPRHLPLPSLRWAWVAPVILIALALTPLGRLPLAIGERELTEEMQAEATAQAESIEREAEELSEVKALTDEEVTALEQLRIEVDSVVEELADSDGLTADEVFGALDARAKAAERLAAQLGLGEDGWASEALIEAMASHSDTANLAEAIRNREASPAADEAEIVSEMLGLGNIPESTMERLTLALEQAADAATEEDQLKPVGERVGNASRKMIDRQPKTASREFEELARHFRYLERREEARETLEELAESLREAGSEIGGSQVRGMEQVETDTSSGESQESGGSDSQTDDGAIAERLREMLGGENSEAGPQSQSLSMAPNGGEGEEENQAPVPGEDQVGAPEGGLEGQEGEAGGISAPVPGEQPPGDSGNEQLAAGSPGSDDSGESDGMLFAPVPGMEGDPGSGGPPIQGGAPSQGRGGNEAGTGTADLTPEEGNSIDAARDSEVIAQINEDGDSSFRAIEGGARDEQANRGAQEVVTDFLAVEEQALDSQQIPRSRRDHILRYFTGIRRSFEKSDTD